jgi:hypothetical protein
MASSPYNSLKGENWVVPLALGKISDVPLDASEDDPVGPLHRPIGLRVVDRSEAQLGSQVRAEFLEFCAIELLAVVHCDLVGYAEAAYYVLPKELLNGG